MKSEDISKLKKHTATSAASNVHKLANDLGVSLSEVKSLSNSSRITMDDIKRHVKECLENQSSQILSQNKTSKKLQVGMHSYNIEYIEEMYEKWISSEEIEVTWKSYFEGFELGKNFDVKNVSSNSDKIDDKQAKFLGMVYAYRALGHTIAKFNPLIDEPQKNPRLTLERLGFSENDFQSVYNTGNYLGGIDLSVKELIDGMEETYCQSIGIEYLHIQETDKRRWIQSQIEPSKFKPPFSKDEKSNIFRNIIEAETFEEFLQSKFLGQKRFSLEGGETLMAILDTILQRCENNMVEELVIGMAHRGRLNVLGNFLDKPLEYIFREFTPDYIPETMYGDGDVKYHLGFETTKQTYNGYNVDIALAANPSHLESVDPVVQGKQEPVKEKEMIPKKEKKLFLF